jgi:hypothetical protein
MLINNSAPLEKNSTQVHQTNNYDLFKSIDGNRNKNALHIQRLRKSIASKYLFTVIIVNENYEIIDGQHRFQVLRELGLPIYYVICKGYSIEEVQILNANSKTWSTTDYLAGYCNMGYPDYIEFDRFMKRHKICWQVASVLLHGGDSGRVVESFKAGTYKIKDLYFAEAAVKKLQEVGKYYDGYKRRWFVWALVRLLKKDTFQFEEFLHKLKQQPTALKHCTDVNEYISVMEAIYNYRRGEKVNLRF